MINFLHTFNPAPLLISVGPINIHWYGLFLVAGIIAALLVSLRLAKHYDVSPDLILDLSFWLIISGLAGARLYDVLLELPYYLKYPLKILAIWEGGLAIHGAVIAGLAALWLFARRHHINFFKLSALLVPGVALGQAIGRWGNYFNQELFGRPTALPWGIPIDILNRPTGYIADIYFHPTFLYESFGCLLIFTVLLAITIYNIKKGKNSGLSAAWLLGLYMILYSILRFSLEFIKIDTTPYFLGLRWPQVMSLTIIIAAISLIIFLQYASRRQKS